MAATVGVIGLGIMGGAMAGNLLEAGFKVVGYDVVPAARRALKRAGGVPARSGADVARRAAIVITSLPSVAALAAVSGEIARARRKGLIVVETSTMPLEAKQAARVAIETSGATLLDCPLSGTGAQARTKDLLVYASGSRTAYRRCVPVFAGFARGHHYLGTFGNGSKMKYVANLLVAIHNVAAAEAMVLARKAGLDLEQTLAVIGDGAGSSRMLQVRGPMMVRDDYSDATMKVAVWQKDMHIIAEYATRLGCPTPLFAASAPLYTAAMAEGFAREDTGSVCAVLGAMAGLERRKRRRSRPA
jgi:3-hydroxyisobutyrate dehydrogenase-like beta-hydroxyacid dehydrogenase